MTKVKMLARFATPTIMAGPDQIIDVADGVADSLIANGYAVLVERVKAKVIETAAVDKVIETAAKTKPVNKKKR